MRHLRRASLSSLAAGSLLFAPACAPQPASPLAFWMAHWQTRCAPTTQVLDDTVDQLHLAAALASPELARRQVDYESLRAALMPLDDPPAVATKTPVAHGLRLFVRADTDPAPAGTADDRLHVWHLAVVYGRDGPATCARATTRDEWLSLLAELGVHDGGIRGWCDFRRACVIAVAPGRPVAEVPELAVATEEGVDVLTVATAPAAAGRGGQPIFLFKVPRRPHPLAVVLREPGAAGERTLQVFPAGPP